MCGQLMGADPTLVERRAFSGGAARGALCGACCHCSPWHTRQVQSGRKSKQCVWVGAALTARALSMINAGPGVRRFRRFSMFLFCVAVARGARCADELFRWTRGLVGASFWRRVAPGCYCFRVVLLCFSSMPWVGTRRWTRLLLPRQAGLGCAAEMLCRPTSLLEAVAEADA